MRRLRQRVEVRRPDRVLLESAELFAGARALEPGGPSRLFARGGAMPVYPQLASLDLLDFAARTLWTEGSDQPQAPIRARRIGEAGRLAEIADGSYDAVLASHVLEHLANPLGALAQWRRVVAPGGHVLLVLPHRDATFDHRRALTTLAHLREDAERATGEDDQTHTEEILALHDLDRDPGAGSREEFERRCRENLATRGMHHHTFTSRSVVEVCQAAGLAVVMLRPKLPLDIFCLCAVGEGREPIDAAALTKALRRSPFATDRSDARNRAGRAS
jgi:SAM-dependent methyltransferase